MAQWAAKNGIKRVFTLVSDFGPGIDAETTFVKSFKAVGGEIVDSVRSPLTNNDFARSCSGSRTRSPKRSSSSFRRAARRSASSRATRSAGLKQAGIRIIATGDLTDDGVLQAMGDPTLGLINSFHYSAAHDSPENKAFLKAYVETNGTKLAPTSWRAPATTGWRRSPRRSRRPAARPTPRSSSRR
jgi:branched-chain amino acid transport system substrate-binding protein